MGSILGGASKTAEHRMNRNRRKQQGFVDVAEITLPNNQSAIIEIVTDENGNEVGYVDDVKIPITDNNVIRREQFSFDDFERGQFQLEQDEAYENGRTLETAEEMNDANNMLDITANEVRRIFGASEDSDVDAMLGDNPLQYALSEYDKDPEIGQTIIDYLNAKATADGAIGAAQDLIELEARKAGALIDSRKSESDGMVHPAKMKLDDRGVYIISGNVKLLDDGSVDTNNSDESIIIMDAATGEKSFATAKDLLSLDDAIDPEAEKAIVRENIAETIATEVENKMLGVLPMNVGDTFPVLADDGSQHTVQIASNDGSGIVEVIMDNEAQTTSANKEIIQQMANAYNRNRAEQFAQGHKEQIQSENISQAPDTKVEESSNAIPLDKQGRPDFNAMEPDMFINEYVSRYGEDNAIKIARKNIEAARANIKKIDKKIDDVLDPNQMQSLFEQKSVAEAQLNRYNDILGRMGASEDANETEDEQRSRLKKESGNRIYNLFPDGFPNVESVILADIATGNRIRWSDKTTNGAVTSRGLAAELGLSDSNAERTRRLALISNSAPTPEEYAESLQERLNELGVRYDESSLRDVVLDVYSSVDTRSGAWKALEEIAAGSQQEDIDTDWEDMQKLVAYEKAQKQEEREQELPDIAMTEDATPITEGEYAELEAQAQAEEQADYDAMMEENTPIEEVQPTTSIVALSEEKIELQNKIQEWLSPENISWAEGKELYESIEKFGNEVEPIAVLPEIIKEYFPEISSLYLYSGKGYLIDHAANHHPELAADEYNKIQEVVDSYDDIKDLSTPKTKKIAFVKMLDKGFAVVTELSEKDGKIMLHKTFFYKDGQGKRVPYKNKPSLLKKSSVGGSTTISPTETAAGRHRNISALDASESKDTTSGPQMQEIGQKNAEADSLTSEDKSTPSIKEVDSKVEIPDVIRGAKWDSTGEPTKMRFKRKGDNFDGYITVGKKKYGRTTSEGEEFDILLEDYGSLESAWNAYERGEVFISPNLASIIKTILIEKGDSTNQSKANADEQVLFRNVYHGSGSEFDKFDHAYMGTGEGHQAFGWGTYVTEVEGIGKQYARMTSKPRLSFKGDFVNIEGFDNPWRIVSDLFSDHHGKLRDMRNAAERYSSLVEDDNPKLKALWEDVKQVLSMVRSGDLKTTPARYLYSVEIPDDNGNNYLHWDREVSEDAIKDLQKNLNLPDTYFVSHYPQTGERVYKALSELLGGDKAASKVLNENGYVGISYPADGGNAGDARNYVIFNEADLDISDSVRFRPSENNIEDANARFNRELDEYINNGVKANTMFHLGLPEDVMRIFLPDLPIVMRPRIINKATNTKHNVDVESLRDLPRMISNPIFVFKRNDNALGVLTEITDRDGKNVCVAIELNKAIQDNNIHLEVNDIRSIHGRDVVNIILPIVYNDTLQWVDKKKGLQWLSSASSNYQQEIDIKDLSSATKIVNDFVNPTIDDVNNEQNIRFRTTESAPAFYSNAERAVENVKQEKATPEQWLKMIEKNGGLKAGEDKWLGLSDWLKASDKKTLTKQEVLDFIKENQIQIEEVEYAENPQGFEELKKEYDGWLRDGGYDYAWDKLIERYGYDSTVAFDDVGGELVVQYGNTASKLLGGKVSTINSTRLDYTTNGLDNKREIALTVPTIESWNESDDIHFGDAGNGRAIAWVRFGETTDAEGNRVLVIDEVQSKRHQEGREKGYRPSNIEQYLKDNGVEVIETGEFYEFHKNGELDKRFSKGLLHNDINRAKQMYVGGYVKSDIPSAPFEKNWAELAMKRMLRYAAENGFDKIAWTTGEQQNQRYNLGDVVNNIRATDWQENLNDWGGENTIEVKIIGFDLPNGDDMQFVIDRNGVILADVNEQYDGRNLADVVGKDIAVKLMAEGEVELDNADLRIGGSGMKAFYDQMIPSFMNKYGKKWGVKVQEVTLPYLEKSSSVMHSIDVTDAMRESVMQGQPMFRLSDNELSRVEELYDDIKTKYNVPGKIVVMPSREEFEQMLLDNGVPQDKLYDYDLAAYIPDSDTFLINGDGIKDTVQAEQVLFHEVLHKLTREVVTLSGLKWLAKNIPSNRLNALSNALWPNGYDSAEAAIDELISIIGENYIIAEKIVDGTPLSALEAYLNNHITLNEATELAKGIMTDAAKEYSDIWDKVFFETKRLLLHYKNAYYEQQRESRGEQVRGVQETMAKGSSREVSPISQTMLGGQAQMAVGAVGKETATRRAEQRQRAIVAEATDLASSLGVKLNVIEDVADITDSNTNLQRAKRGAKAWYDVATDQVYFVSPNATSIADAQESVLHEVVAHKGLRDVVGRENFNKFLDKVFYNAAPEIRAQITRLAAQNGWNFRVATEEYLASLAERGFNDRAERTFWQKVRDLFMDMLREAKIAIGYNINDNDMRYMLWRTYQMQKSQGAMAVAEDVVMQQKMGVGNFRTRQMTEEEQIVADAKANGSYLKAPNGKDTNLTPKQWVTVRTDAFKKWFGDWEKAARIEKLRTSKDATITGDEIEVSDDLKQYKKNAQLYGRTLQGEYTNADTGAVISLQRGRHNGGINEVLHHNYKDVAHLQSVAAIPQIIENGIYIESQPNKDVDTNPNVTEYQMFVCGLNIGGEDYTVLAKVAVDNNGNRYYDHNLVSVEKGKLIDIANNEQSAISSGFGTTPDTKSTTNSQRKYKELISLLQTNSSKIVDANGEPKVVWHGGGFAIDNFTPKGDMHFGTKNAALERILDQEVGYDDVEVTQNEDGSYSWKYSDPYEEDGDIASEQTFETETDAYENAVSVLAKGVVVKPYFLNIRNIAPMDDAGSDWANTIQDAKDEGHDGILYENWYEDKGSDSYIAFNPNQIKSATDNVGTFDANNDDIRFRSDKPEPATQGTARAQYDYAVRKHIKDRNNVGRVENLWHHFMEHYQDSMRSVKSLYKAILDETGNKLHDYEDVYKAENHLSSKNKAQIEAWERDYMKPLQKEILSLIEDGADYNMILYYLLAKHGIERNRVLAQRDAEQIADSWELKRLAGAQRAFRYEEKRINGSYGGNMAALKKALDTGAISQEHYNTQAEKLEKQRNKDLAKIERKYNRLVEKIKQDKPDMYDRAWDKLRDKDYSGLTELTGDKTTFNQSAQDMVDAFEAAYGTKKLWEVINAATKATLRKSYDSGMMNKETYEKTANMFKYYIPLRGWENNAAADYYEYLSSPNMKILPALKTAKGRTSRADDPIATIGSMGESSIIQGNRNLMKQKLLNFAQNNPTSLLTVSEQWYVRQPDGTWMEHNPIIPENATGDEVDAIVKKHEADMIALGENATKGRSKLNLGMHATTWEGQEHVVRVKRNGKEYQIFVNGNPIAAQAINGFTNPNTIEGWIKRVGQAIKNFMARAFTSQNPAFIGANLSRDVVWAGTAVAIKEDAAYAAQYTKNIAEAFGKAQLPRLISKWQKGTLDINIPIERYFKEFIENGGETGFTQLNTVDDYKRNMERFIKEAQSGPANYAKKSWRWVWDGIEFLNRSAEDTTRFAVYLTSRQMGRSITDSVSNAKDITVNFNKKGRGGYGATFFNFAYIFFNATIQSLANFGSLLKNHPKKTVTALTTFASVGLIAPMLSLAIQSMLSDDDEEPTYWDLPEWVRRNNIVIYMPFIEGGHLTIPLPHELRPFYGMGELAFSVLMGKESVEDALKKSIEGFASLLPFDYTGNGGNVVVNFTPTIAQPFAQLIVNKDYFGTPIYRKTAFNEKDPEWTKAYKSTNRTLVDATELVNKLTGGNAVKSGMIDINPAIVEHLFESYLGGMGKTINRTAKTLSMLWDEDAREWRNVPVLSSFYTISDERTSGSQLNREYFDAVSEAEDVEHLLSGYKKQAKLGAVEYAELLKDLMESDIYKRYEKVKGYKDAISELNTALKEIDDPLMNDSLETQIMNLKVDMLEELNSLENK